MARRIAQELALKFGDATIKVEINITSQKIKFKLNISGEYPKSIDLAHPEIDPIPVPYEYDYEDYEISLETFKKYVNFRSNMLIGLVTSDSFPGGELTSNNMINVSNLTKDDRVQNAIASRLPVIKSDYFICIFVNDPNGTFDDQDIIVYLPSGIQSENITSNVVLEKPETFSHLELVDNITITEDTAYSNPDYYKFNVSTETYIDEVFLEQVFGIVDRARVTITNGSGSFRVLKSSVESGNKVKVKAGFYSYPGITSITKTV